jgi:TM2 domain-containing membrane protein YozV
LIYFVRGTFAALFVRAQPVQLMKKDRAMTQGSAGNVISAAASFFIPGLGQLFQGRFLAALLFFVFAALFWLIMLGWVFHLWAILDAALFKNPDHKRLESMYRS